MVTFIGGNKGRVLNVRASLGSFCILLNEEKIICMLWTATAWKRIFIKDLGSVLPYEIEVLVVSVQTWEV